MARHCLPLGDLDRERIADIDRKLGLKLDGSPLAANTANRIRIVARASVQAAIEAGAVAADANLRLRSLGHRLGISVLAEGVETDEAWQQLKRLGCDEIQGFVFSRPMPSEQIEGWITSHQHNLAATVSDNCDPAPSSAVESDSTSSSQRHG